MQKKISNPRHTVAEIVTRELNYDDIESLSLSLAFRPNPNEVPLNNNNLRHMVRVTKARQAPTAPSLRFLARHLFAVFTVALVGLCVSVYFFLLGVEVSFTQL